MSRDFLTHPARVPFRAAQGIAVAVGTAWVAVDARPEGQVVWHEDQDCVILTPERRLVHVNGGGVHSYARLPGMEATDALLRELQGRG
jgi:hypothetical protein